MSLFPKKSRVSLYGLWMMNRWMDVVHIPGLTPHHLSFACLSKEKLLDLHNLLSKPNKMFHV